MVIERFRTLLAAGDFTALADAYAPEALLDANVPSWRLQRRGPTAIIEQFAAVFAAGPPRFVEWDPRPTDFGAVVELEIATGEGAEELRFREVHLFATSQDRITSHTFYCTGAWDVETRTRHAIESGLQIPAGR